MNLLASTASNAAARLLLSFAVSVSILQTPLPVAHAHRDIASTRWLSDHLDHHHQDDSVDADEVHWHLAIPGHSNPGHSNEDQPVDSQQGGSNPVAVVASTVSTIAVDLNRMQRDWLPLKWVERPARTTLALAHQPSVLRLAVDCAPSASDRVCALLCVIRC